MAARIRIEFDRPKTCGECLFSSQEKIRGHGENFDYTYCALGFMDNDPKRWTDRSKKMYQGCRLNRYAVPVSEYRDDYYIKPPVD